MVSPTSSSSSSNLRADSSRQQDQHRQLVVGGQVTKPGKYPYFVLINGECGGSLIAPDVVLTAGHCKPRRTIAKGYGIDDPDDMDYVRVGIFERHPKRHHDTDDDEFNDDTFVDVLQEESFAVLDATRHSHFKRFGDDEFRYDYSLILLNGTSIHPHVELYRHELNATSTEIQVTAMGMGDTDKDRPSRSNYLREVNLTVVPNDVCEHTHGRGISYKGRIHKTHLCTFGDHKDTCNYDSGSPIIIHNDQGEHALVGMVSWGEECADDIFPAVNSRISEALDWINEIVCDWSEYPPPSFGCYPTDAPTMVVVAGGDWRSHLPKPGDHDFVIVVLLCMLVAGTSRFWWKLRRRDCDYTQLK